MSQIIEEYRKESLKELMNLGRNLGELYDHGMISVPTTWKNIKKKYDVEIREYKYHYWIGVEKPVSLDEIKNYLGVKDSLRRVEGWSRRLPDGEYELAGILFFPTQNNVILLLLKTKKGVEELAAQRFYLKTSLSEEKALKLGKFLGAVLSEKGICVSKVLWTFYKSGSEDHERFMEVIDRIASDIYKIPKKNKK